MGVVPERGASGLPLEGTSTSSLQHFAELKKLCNTYRRIFFRNNLLSKPVAL